MPPLGWCYAWSDAIFPKVMPLSRDDATPVEMPPWGDIIVPRTMPAGDGFGGAKGALFQGLGVPVGFGGAPFGFGGVLGSGFPPFEM